jgi:hypothetical protein
VNAAAVSKLVVSGLTTPRTAGTAGSIRVTATDAYGNRIRGQFGQDPLHEFRPEVETAGSHTGIVVTYRRGR